MRGESEYLHAVSRVEAFMESNKPRLWSLSDSLSLQPEAEEATRCQKPLLSSLPSSYCRPRETFGKHFSVLV